MTEVVTLGEVLTLFLAQGGTPLSQAIGFERSLAGAEANVAVGLARLGHSVAFIGRVGADPFGAQIQRSLRGEGIDVSGLSADSARATGLIVRDAPTGRPVSVSYYRSGSAGSALSPAHVDADAIRRARILHVTGITAALSPSAHAALLFAASVAREAGIPVSFDPNLRLRLAPVHRWSSLVQTFAPFAETVLVGADELRLLGLTPRSFLDLGARLVVVKDGARGAMVTDGTVTESVPARAVASVDPVGAGDAFAAGWLSATLRDRPLADRLREAAVVASCVVAAHGDLPGLPDAATRDRLSGDHADVDR